MAEYEDCDLGSPGPNSSLTLEDLRARMRCLVESLEHVREMVSETSLGFHNTLQRLDGLARGVKEMQQELKNTRETMEQKKAKLDQELDPQTERAMSKFLVEHLKTTTPREDFALCRKIRGSYPEMERESTSFRHAEPVVAQPMQFAETGLFLF